MDFFENVVSKAKDVFDVAYKKTEEVVNTGKVKLEIATLENKLAKDFERLGRIYFEQIKEADCDIEVHSLKSAIYEKQEKIANLKEELDNQWAIWK